MPTAARDSDMLVDVLSDIADVAREVAHGVLGSRPYRVFLVTRIWGGPERGLGGYTAIETEILPPPEVRDSSIRSELRGFGREEEGNVTLLGVSLTYGEAELNPSVGKLVEFAYRIDDAHLTGRKPKFYTMAGPPTARRGDQFGDEQDWVVPLKRAADMLPTDGM